MAEHLDDKLTDKWNTMPTRKLLILLYNRISQRLDRLEQGASLTPLDIPDVDMNKIKRVK